LDDPPIVMWQDRVKVALPGLAMAVAAVLTYGLGSASAASLFWSILLSLMAVLMGWMAIVRSCLILAPEGLTWRTWIRTFDYEWGDFERFIVVSARSRMVAGVLSERCKRRRPWFSRWIGLKPFGGFWELPQQQIVDVLNEARRHWGPARESS